VATALVSAALVVAAIGCEKASVPARPLRQPAPPASTDEAMERVRAELPDSPAFAAWNEVAVPAIRTEAMEPAAGLALWHQLRAARDRLAMTPVVIDSDLRIEHDGDAASQALARARTSTAAAFFRRRADAWAADGFGEELRPLDPGAIAVRAVRAPAFEFVMRNQRDAETKRLNPELANLLPPLAVRVALIAAPARDLPAHLVLGGWNECPQPDEHVIVLDAWRRRYGAEVVFVGGDTLELLVERPVVVQSELAALAREQFLYCADIVTQGTGDLEALARELSGAASWYFWWD
jgi:hypothetical protein